MDSGNSGSLQSSSGGDEEYDSRAAAESFSAFISHPSRLLQLQPPPFDPVSNYYFQIQNSNSPLFNPNVLLPSNMNPRSDEMGYSNHPSDDQNIINSGFMPSFQPATEVSDRVGLGPPPPPSTVADNNRTRNKNETAARNPKKRSRASRRAPTTVLTTDTTNFRAMVQEFTGIPAPPFNSSAPFQRSRFDDLFSNTPFTSMIRSPLIHRPFSQKVQSPPPPPPPPPPLQSPFLVSSTSSSTSNNAVASTCTPPTTHLSNHLFNNISNPILTSFLENNNKFPFSNSINNLGSKTHIQGPNLQIIPSNEHSNNKIDEFSLGSHGTSTVSPNLNSTLPNQIQPRRNNNNNNASDDDDLTRWRNNAANPDQPQTRLVHIGNYNFSRNGGKVNHLGSTSNFHGEKEQLENVANRSEGMVESWICSSEYK